MDVRARTAVTIGAVLLAGVGLWQLGEGAWIHVKARLAQHLLQRAWMRTLAGASAVKPWPWADTWPVARLRVPAHAVDLIVLAGVSGRTLAFGPGQAPRTAGTGLTILSGHRDTHFRFLEHVTPADEIVLETPAGPPSRFRVQETTVVDARTAVIRPPAQSSVLILITCYPFGAITPGGPLRYLVTAESSP